MAVLLEERWGIGIVVTVVCESVKFGGSGIQICNLFFFNFNFTQ